MKDLVSRAGITDVVIASAGTSSEELGNPVHYGTRKKLAQHGISCDGKFARQMTKQDYGEYDLLIGMDNANIRHMNRICGGDPQGKIRRLLDYTNRPGEVADPWYTGDFEETWCDVLEGCQAVLDMYWENFKG